jgi:hypothetical protein
MSGGGHSFARFCDNLESHSFLWQKMFRQRCNDNSLLHVHEVPDALNAFDSFKESVDFLLGFGLVSIAQHFAEQALIFCGRNTSEDVC